MKKRHKGRPARDPVRPHAAPMPAPIASALPQPPIATEPQIPADSALWRALLLALETRPVGPQELRGASGLIHSAMDVGIDSLRDRLVVLTDSSDPKIAAFMQSDVQQVYPKQKVIVARTVLVNVSAGLTSLRDAGLSNLDLSKLKAASPAGPLDPELQRTLETLLTPILGDKKVSTHSPAAFLMQLVSQVGALDWRRVKPPSDGEPTFSLDPLLADNVLDADKQLGICPIPVHAMNADEVERAKSSAGIGEARGLLQRHGVFEYFFPEASELALGLIDRGISSGSALSQAIALANEKGHPVSGAEDRARLDAVISDLHAKGLVVEGELGLQTTIAGAEARAVVRFKPKESLLVKLRNLIPLAGSLLKYFLGKPP